MMMANSTQTYVLKNSISEIKKLHAIVTELGQIYNMNSILSNRLELSLDELLTNTISYGYKDSPDQHKEITIKINPLHQSDLEKKLLQITITDDAVAFDPTMPKNVDLESDLEDRPIGGLGIHLVKTFMETVSYKRINNQNILTLVLDLNNNLIK